MTQLTVKLEDSKFKIYSDENLYGEIVFDKNNIEASLITNNKILRAERTLDKNIQVKYENQTLFTYNFDYIWGGAELILNGLDTGFDIKGRWFKPGTRLTDNEEKDLVIVVKKNDGLSVSILEENVSAEMILATIYYHIYSSGGKMLSILIGSVA